LERGEMEKRVKEQEIGVSVADVKKLKRAAWEVVMGRVFMKLKGNDSNYELKNCGEAKLWSCGESDYNVVSHLKIMG
jgi:hypothetical protein